MLFPKHISFSTMALLVIEVGAVDGAQTFTTNVHVSVLPDASVATYCTVVFPTGNVSPELWVLVKTTPEQLSDAVGAVHVTTLDTELMLPGQPVIAGSSASVTTTLNEHVEINPCMSVAV
jgi:hypothetical protein